MSNRVQLAAVASIIALLLATVIASAFYVRASDFTPFLPDGFLPVGTAAALIFWSYLGYENVSNVAEEFESPQRDFKRSIVLSALVVSGLYLSVSIVTIGTNAYKSGGNIAPFAVMLSHVVGAYGASGTAILAVFIIFSTINAYTVGMSRVFYAVSKDGGFPRVLDHIHPKTKVPDRALIALFLPMIPSFAVYYFLNVNLETALLVPSGAAILVYVIGSAAGVKILGNRSEDSRRIPLPPTLSLAMSLLVLPFVGWPILFSVIVCFAAFLFASLSSRFASHKEHSGGE